MSHAQLMCVLAGLVICDMPVHALCFWRQVRSLQHENTRLRKELETERMVKNDVFERLMRYENAQVSGGCLLVSWLVG